MASALDDLVATSYQRGTRVVIAKMEECRGPGGVPGAAVEAVPRQSAEAVLSNLVPLFEAAAQQQHPGMRLGRWDEWELLVGGELLEAVPDGLGSLAVEIRRRR